MAAIMRFLSSGCDADVTLDGAGVVCLGLEIDRRLSAARAIVERQRAFDHGALDAALNRLMMKPGRSAHRKKRRVLLISQQYPRPLDPAQCETALSMSTLRYPNLRETTQLHAATLPCLPSRSLVGTHDISRHPKALDEILAYDNFREIDCLGKSPHEHQ